MKIVIATITEGSVQRSSDEKVCFLTQKLAGKIVGMQGLTGYRFTSKVQDILAQPANAANAKRLRAALAAAVQPK